MRMIPFLRGRTGKTPPKTPQIDKEQERTYSVNIIEEYEEENAADLSEGSFVLSDSDDAFSENLLTIIFGIIEERRKMFSLVAKYKEQVAETQTINAGIIEEKKQLASSLEERDNQLRSLQGQINEHQEKYQELIEEHKESEINSLKERQKLQQQVKELEANYEGLADELKKHHEETRIKVTRYKDDLRLEKEKYNRLLLQHKKLSEDNTDLVEKIASFTRQISSVQMLNNVFSTEQENSDTNNL